jgi:hypothetical protein
MKKLILLAASLVLIVPASNAQIGTPRTSTTVSNNNFGTRLGTNYGRNYGVGQPNTALGQTPGLAIRPTTPALQPGTPALQPGTTAINPTGGTPGIPPAIGQQGSTSIGQQNSTAIGPQTPSQPNAIIVNADGSITRVPAAGGTVGVGLGGTNFGFGTNGAIVATNRVNQP